MISFMTSSSSFISGSFSYFLKAAGLDITSCRGQRIQCFTEPSIETPIEIGKHDRAESNDSAGKRISVCVNKISTEVRGNRSL